MPAEKSEKAAVYEFENRGRTQWVLEILADKEGDPPKEVVFGDMVNRIVADESTRHPVYQRSPVVRLTAEEHAKLAPASRKLLDKLVATHEIDKRELAA
jgi:hypothetical protein